MPSPDGASSPTVRPLSTAEAGKWLRMLLIDGKFEISSRKITSHTLKCSFLIVPRGASLLKTGEFLAGNRVPLRCSRDSAGGPLAVLENLIAETYQDKFCLDCTRSGRLVDSAEKGCSNVKVEEGFEVISDNDEASEESGYATTSSHESESETHVLAKEPRWFWNKHVAPEGTCLWQHKKLKTLHLANIGYQRVFICNRPINENYNEGSEFHRYDTPKCKCCFNSFKKAES